MKEYAFEVNLSAVIRVRASDEDIARQVLPSVIGAPGLVEIKLANENNAAIGVNAAVTDVSFDPKIDEAELRDPGVSTSVVDGLPINRTQVEGRGKLDKRAT